MVRKVWQGRYGKEGMERKVWEGWHGKEGWYGKEGKK
jgi:hypothetical protein